MLDAIRITVNFTRRHIGMGDQVLLPQAMVVDQVRGFQKTGGSECNATIATRDNQFLPRCSFNLLTEPFGCPATHREQVGKCDRHTDCMFRGYLGRPALTEFVQRA